MVFYRFQVKLSLDILRDGPALISGKKLPLTTVITFFELDSVGPTPFMVSALQCRLGMPICQGSMKHGHSAFAVPC